jgi:hypothetical protein
MMATDSWSDVRSGWLGRQRVKGENAMFRVYYQHADDNGKMTGGASHEDWRTLADAIVAAQDAQRHGITPRHESRAIPMYSADIVDDHGNRRARFESAS